MVIGDVVAIRGDRRTAGSYTPDQLVDGKYVRHSGHNGIWTGVIDKVLGDMALCAGGWRGVEMYEVMYCGQSRR